MLQPGPSVALLPQAATALPTLLEHFFRNSPRTFFEKFSLKIFFVGETFLEHFLFGGTRLEHFLFGGTLLDHIFLEKPS